MIMEVVGVDGLQPEEPELLWFEELVAQLGDPFADPGVDLSFEYPPSTVPSGDMLQQLLDATTSALVNQYGTGAWQIIASERQTVDVLMRANRGVADAAAGEEGDAGVAVGTSGLGVVGGGGSAGAGGDSENGGGVVPGREVRRVHKNSRRAPKVQGLGGAGAADAPGV